MITPRIHVPASIITHHEWSTEGNESRFRRKLRSAHMRKYVQKSFTHYSLLLLWYIDPLLGNDSKINETTAVDRQWPASNNGSTGGISVFLVVRSDRSSSVQLSGMERVGRWVSELENCCSSVCDLLLWAANSWGTGIARKSRIRRTSAVGSRWSSFQATTAEDTAEWKDLVRALVNCRMCELAITV
jgi:hypothetical protein